MNANEELSVIRIYHTLKRGEALEHAQVVALLDSPELVDAVVERLKPDQIIALARLLESVRSEIIEYGHMLHCGG